MPNPNGRPRKLDDAARDAVLRRVLRGASVRQAAKLVGCTPRTVQRDAARDEDFAWRLDLARRARDELQRRLRDAERPGPDESPADAELAQRLADEVRQLWGAKTPSADVA